MNKKSLPILITVLFMLSGMFFLLWKSLYNQPEVLPSPLVGKPVPAFHLANILDPANPFTEQDLKGHITLLNVWASWCSACEMEHPLLLEIKKNYPYLMYSINYKDDSQQAKAFLEAMGNPYTVAGNDQMGEVAMDLGVYGTPETFIVDKNGIIVYRHVGAITEEDWHTKMLPILKRLD